MTITLKEGGRWERSGLRTPLCLSIPGNLSGQAEVIFSASLRKKLQLLGISLSASRAFLLCLTGFPLTLAAGLSWGSAHCCLVLMDLKWWLLDRPVKLPLLFVTLCYRC